MRLRINYRLSNSDTTARYEVRIKVINTGQSHRYLPEGVASQPIETLAQKWFAVHGDADRHDRNVVLCGDLCLQLIDKSLESLTLNAGETFTSSDPIALAALVQRVKRAFSFGLDGMRYDVMFEFGQEEISDGAVVPRGVAPQLLADVPEKILEFVENR